MKIVQLLQLDEFLLGLTDDGKVFQCQPGYVGCRQLRWQLVEQLFIDNNAPIQPAVV